MNKSKYYLTFLDFLKKIDNLGRIDIPKGYEEINGTTIKEKPKKIKKSKQR